MLIRRIRVVGYQAFQDSGWINWGAGLHFILGQNSSGKSSLVSALRTALQDDRHKSPSGYLQNKLPIPEIFVDVCVSGPEVSNSLYEIGEILFPVNSDAGEVMVENYFAQESHDFMLRRSAGGDYFSKIYPSHGLFTSDLNKVKQRVTVTAREGKLLVHSQASDNSDHVASLASRILTQSLFVFSAERLSIGESPAMHINRLEPDASNLPAVLNTLQTNQPYVFDNLRAHMRYIFPTFGNMTARLKPNYPGTAELLVWPTADNSNAELAFSLRKSGTGIGQVLAILTVVMTLKNAIVVIDEINSFLHPAATKKLIRLLSSEYPENQYIITSHSTEALAAAAPSSVHLVSRDGYNSSIKPIDLTEIVSIRNLATELGFSMSDVFVAERVLWVEGRTEEICFDFIAKRFDLNIRRGTEIRAVCSTGDFHRSRDSSLVYEIYERLTGAFIGFSPEMLFSFDPENLTTLQQEEIANRTNGHLYFLPRRHIECYLVNVGAIAHFINSEIIKLEAQNGVRSALVSERDIDELIHRYALQYTRVQSTWVSDIRNVTWLENVNAAKLISHVCAELTTNRVQFVKADHSVVLLKWIVENFPQEIQSLIQYVTKLFAALGNIRTMLE